MGERLTIRLTPAGVELLANNLSKRGFPRRFSKLRSLLSHENRWVNGQRIEVSGGMSLWSELAAGIRANKD